jgi:ADP-heptose:LPS heptosyltransferase
VREAATALKRCLLYIGNDTGTMHLAASLKVRCVAIFSARDLPGRWQPLGKHHIVLRKQVPCEGCMLVTCVEHGLACLAQIGIDEVEAAATRVLDDAGMMASPSAGTPQGVATLN